MDVVDYAPAPPPRPRRGLGPVIVSGLLVVAQLQLLLCLLGPNAPVRQGFGRDTPVAAGAEQQEQLAQQVVQRVGTEPVEVHFVQPRPPSPASGMVACEVYYGLNYALWPGRAVVGDGRAVVNDAATLAAADALPPASALAGRVAATLTCGIGPGGVTADLRPVALPPVDGRRR